MTEVRIFRVDLPKGSFQVCGTERGVRFYLTGWFRVQSSKCCCANKRPVSWRWRHVRSVTSGDVPRRGFVASQIDVAIERHRLVTLEQGRATLAADLAAREEIVSDREARLTRVNRPFV